MQILVAVLIAACVGSVSWALLDLVFSEERQVARRLKSLSESERREAGEIEPLSTPFRRRVIKPAGSSLASLGRRLTPGEYRERLDARCRTAGNPAGVTADAILAIQILLAIGLAAGCALLAGVVWASSASALLGAIVGLVAGWILPNVWLEQRLTERQDQIRRELPDMLDMLTITVEAGLGFDAAVAKYVQNQSGPLAQEFSVMLREVQAGVTRRDAMRALAKRCNVSELGAFVMAMVQADVFGVSIGSVLRTQSHEMRLKRRQHAEEVAQKAPAKMVFPLILCVLPATLIVLMTPAVISIARALGMMN